MKMDSPLTADEVIDMIYTVSSFLTGYGDVTDVAVTNLNKIMTAIEQRGVAQSEAS